MKKIISAMISAAVGVSLLTALPVTAVGTSNFDIGFAETVDAGETSGKCGDNVYWELQGTKLVITGSGEMNVFDTLAAAPWYSQRTIITEVEIGEGVTTVTPCGFGMMNKLIKVTIPSTATYIGRLAFSSCTALSSVEIPARVEFIGQGAFRSCSSLQSVTIYGSNTEIKGGKETISSKGSQYDPNYSFSGTIYGVNGSKAQSYASNNNIKFQTIGSLQNETTTMPTTTTTTTAKTTTSTTTSKTTTSTTSKTTTSTTTTTTTSFKTTTTTPATTTTTTTTAPHDKDYSLGDVNGDNYIDAVDASMVLSEYAKVSSNLNGSFNDKQKKAANVDNNSYIDAVDASKILSYYAYVSSGNGQKVTLSEFIKK